MKVLVIGGYGAFGRRIVNRIHSIPGLNVSIAGRSLNKRSVLQPATGRSIESHVIDIRSKGLANRLYDMGINLVIHTAGPFDASEAYAVARACITSSLHGQKCHYIDLADNTDYVKGFSALNDEAVQAGCTLLTGASTTPAITSAVIEHFFPSTVSHFMYGGDSTSTLTSVTTDLSVANSSMPGEGTVRSVLSYCGRPVEIVEDGHRKTISAWSHLKKTHFFGMRKPRLCSDVDVPDNVIYMGQNKNACLREFRFRAGVESYVSMLGLSAMATSVRWGLIRDWTPWSAPLLSLNALLRTLSGNGGGGGGGGMMMHMKGKSGGEVRWGIYASEETGPEIPCTPAVILTKKFLAYHQKGVADGDHLLRAGARPCVEVISLQEFTGCTAEEGFDLQQYIQTSSSSDQLPPEWPEPNLCTLFPVFGTLDWASQCALSPSISEIHREGGIAAGCVEVYVHQSMVVRWAAQRVGLPIPRNGNESDRMKVLVSMSPHHWKRMFHPCMDDCRDKGPPDNSHLRMVTFESFFYALPNRHLLAETVGRILHTLYLQKSLPRATDGSYQGFKMEYCGSSLFGFVPVPKYLSLQPRAEIVPHNDGGGWDLDVSASLPILGEIVRYTGSLRVALTASTDNTSMAVVNAIKNVYGIRDSRIEDIIHNGEINELDFAKILGKSVLIFDGDCGMCDSIVQLLLRLDTKGDIIYSPCNSRKSEILLELSGVSRDRFADEKDDTIFVIDPFGNIHTRFSAVLAIIGGTSVCGIWKGPLLLLSLFPRRIMNYAYSFVARNRYRVFGRKSTCSVPTKQELQRFL